MYTAALWVKKALRINMNLFKMASVLQNNLHTFRSDQSIESKEITNLQQLHDADYVYSNLNPMDHPHLFKRYSYVWQDLIQQSVMCDYISYDSIGLSGLKAMRNYFKKFIKQEGPQCCEISKYVVLFVKCLYSVESAMSQDVDGITVLVRCYRVDSL